MGKSKEHKKKLTAAQKYNQDFENLSLEIVKQLFSEVDAEISKTTPVKDGGYDIVVEYKDGTTIRKVYFECKLRSGNLNLRDISANLIIAFNEGAIALVVITNYDYTEQANENIYKFYNKTILNVKIIIGEDIQKICRLSNIQIKNELSAIITPKNTQKKSEYQFLRLDLNQSNIWKQIICNNNQNTINKASFIYKIYQDESERLQKFLLSGKTVFISGLLGVGKSSIIKSVLSNMSCRIIHIVADNYMSQSQLLLGIFLDIWGIPLHAIVQQFSDDIVEKIICTIDKKCGENQTGQIVRHLLGKTVPEGISDEHYNALICDYLIHQLVLHRENFCYIFFIEAADMSPDEVQILLAYIVKLLNKNKIGCVIEKEDEEYQILKSTQHDIFFEQLKNVSIYNIPIRYLKPEEAQAFVQNELSDYPHMLQQQIQKKGGVRLLTLNILVTYIKEIYFNEGMHAKFLKELQLFSPNDLPAPLHYLLSFYFESYSQVFHYFFLFGGKLPLEWLDELIDNDSIINKLLDLKFIDIDDNYLIVSNQIVMDKIIEFSERSLSIRKSAKVILEFLEKTEDNYYTECKIQAYSYLGKNNKALKLLDYYMRKLHKERQYSAFLNYLDIAMENIVQLDYISIKQQAELIISGLEIWSIKKEIHSEKAKQLLAIFENLVGRMPLEQKNDYLIILDFFKSKKYFKECYFNESKSISEKYYIQCIESNSSLRTKKWIDKLCIVYALSIKELDGNEEAWKVYSEINKIFPKSFWVQVELWSHEACMHFYDNPQYSLKAINNILELHKKEQCVEHPLPFHEYVDRAMCAFCAKDYQVSLEYSNEAIRILESNGVIPTLGRAYNIKGCVMVCLDILDEAERCFKEACFAMDESNYRLFSWRSRLNLLQLDILYKRNHIKNAKQLLDETYSQFKEIYQKKIYALKRDTHFTISREYFALLMFGHLYICLNFDRTSDIVNDFLFKNEENQYKEHLYKLTDKRIKNVYFNNCSYAMNKYLFMVG